MNTALIIGLLIIVIIFGLFFSQRSENFGLFCKNCGLNGWRGQTDCYECNNCGWCIDPNGYGSCVLGGPSGPKFADCRSYFHKGTCVYGPECGYDGPLYVAPIWYNPFTWWGPRRYRRRIHRVPRRAGGRWPSRRYGGGGRRGGGRRGRR